MTPKQRKFVAMYIGKAKMNGTEAALLAGYSSRNAREQASRLLSKANIAAAIEAHLSKVTASSETTLAEWQAELRRIAFGDIRKVVTWQANVTGMVEDEDGTERLAVTNQVQIIDADKLDAEAAAMISEVRQSDKGGLAIKLHSKLRALELIGKAHGFLADDSGQVQVNVGVQFVGIPERETREQWLERKARERSERLAGPAHERAG